MNNISMNQALSVWSDLWQAFYKDNGYGTDTAEIYAYRLMPYIPTYKHIESETGKEVDSIVEYNAALSLRNLVSLFCDVANCLCTIDGLDCDTWLARTHYFDHRCHIKVIHKGEDEK